MLNQQRANLAPETINQLVFGSGRQSDDAVFVGLAPRDRDVGSNPGLARLLPRDASRDGVGPGGLNEFDLARPEAVSELVTDESERVNNFCRFNSRENARLNRR